MRPADPSGPKDPIAAPAAQKHRSGGTLCDALWLRSTAHRSEVGQQTIIYTSNMDPKCRTKRQGPSWEWVGDVMQSPVGRPVRRRDKHRCSVVHTRVLPRQEAGAQTKLGRHSRAPPASKHESAARRLPPRPLHRPIAALGPCAPQIPAITAGLRLTISQPSFIRRAQARSAAPRVDAYTACRMLGAGRHSMLGAAAAAQGFVKPMRTTCVQLTPAAVGNLAAIVAAAGRGHTARQDTGPTHGPCRTKGPRRARP